jgi:hypothetical protein
VVWVPAKCGSGQVTVDADEELTYEGKVVRFEYKKTYSVETVAGSALPSTLNSAESTSPGFTNIVAMTIDTANNIYVIDHQSADPNRDFYIRKVKAGNLEVAKISPDMGFDPKGAFICSQNKLFFMDPSNRRIKRASLENSTTFTTVGSQTDLGAAKGLVITPDRFFTVDTVTDAFWYKGASGSANFGKLFGAINTTSSVDGFVGQASIFNPSAIAYDAISNRIYFTEPSPMNKLRALKLSSSIFDSEVETIAGEETSSVWNDGVFDITKSNHATFYNPDYLACDGKGNIYIHDRGVNQIRLVSLANKKVEVIAGADAVGFKDDIGTKARFLNPGPMCVDSRGNLYIADGTCIRKITIE